MIKGKVFNIERYAIYDGKGIRTIVFLKGCPLSCLWCANPEGQNMGANIIYSKNLCILCKACQAVCRADAIEITDTDFTIYRDRCIGCGKCEEVCYAGAIRLDSKEMTAGEVMAEVIKDKDFYKTSGGGMTISGGEPFTQGEFCYELLKDAKEKGIDTAVESCGYADIKIIEKCMPYIEALFYDVKLMDSKKHKELTGYGNEKILENLKEIQKFNKPITIRTPVIEGINDSDSDIIEIANFIKGLKSVVSYELLPYHKLGISKYKNLGIPYFLTDKEPTDIKIMERLKRKAEEMGISCKIRI